MRYKILTFLSWYRYILSIIAWVIHELSHILMLLILFPLVRSVDMKLFTLGGGRIGLRMSYQTRALIVSLLITIAPNITLYGISILIAYLVVYKFYLGMTLIGFIVPMWQTLNMSKQDRISAWKIMRAIKIYLRGKTKKHDYLAVFNRELRQTSRHSR